MTNQAFREACGLYAEELVHDARLRRGGFSHGLLLQQAFVLVHLQERCATRLAALAELKALEKNAP